MRENSTVKQKIDKLVSQSILELSNSRLSSPLVRVNKPDGSMRLCGDCRQLNNITPQWQAHIAVLSEILDRVGKAHVLSKASIKCPLIQRQGKRQPLPPLLVDIATTKCPLVLKTLRQYFRILCSEYLLIAESLRRFIQTT